MTTVRDEICNLLAEYAHALDDGRVDDLVALFTADATIDFPGTALCTGTDALRDQYDEWRPSGPQRHVVVNTRVTDSGATAANATSDFVFLTRDKGGWSVSLVGRYEDELVYDGAAWRFKYRRATFS